MPTEVLAALVGALATALLGGTGWLIGRLLHKHKDPVERFIEQYERVSGIAIRADSSVVPTAAVHERSATAIGIGTPAAVAQHALPGPEVILSATPASFTIDAPSAEVLTQAEMNQRAAESRARAEERLEARLGAAMALLGDEELCSDLAESQRSWLRYRDLHAGVVADSSAKGGTMWPCLFDAEREVLTKRRIEELERLIEREREWALDAKRVGRR